MKTEEPIKEPVKILEVPKETVPKTLENISTTSAKVNIPDIKIVGNPDCFQLLCKASSKSEGWMKSAKAYQINEIGCIIQVTTQQGDNISEALCFVPGVSLLDDVNNGKRLVKSENV